MHLRRVIGLIALLSACATVAPGEPTLRTELYFGTSSHGHEVVSEAEWEQFLASEVTPRFPDGLTVLTGRGQWLGTEGLAREESHVLVLLYPSSPESEASIQLIRQTYCARFHQESVVRVTQTASVER